MNILTNFNGISCFFLLYTNKSDELTSFLEKELSQWEPYLSYRLKDDYIGNIPKDRLEKTLDIELKLNL